MRDVACFNISAIMGISTPLTTITALKPIVGNPLLQDSKASEIVSWGSTYRDENDLVGRLHRIK